MEKRAKDMSEQVMKEGRGRKEGKREREKGESTFNQFVSQQAFTMGMLSSRH